MSLRDLFCVTNHFLVFICENDQNKINNVENKIKCLSTSKPSTMLSPCLWRITFKDTKPVYASEIVKFLCENGAYRIVVLRITDDIGLNWCLDTGGSEELSKITENPNI